MSETTPRDRVWRAALELALTRTRAFRIRNVTREMDDPPSKKTVERTLRAMTELDVLEHEHGEPVYFAGELLDGRR